MTKTKKGISGSTLKIIAIIAMFIDHFSAIFVDGYVQQAYPANVMEMSSEAFYQWSIQNPWVPIITSIGGVMRLIGRLGFPIFAFLLVEGFMHTSNVKKYARNLLIFALISEIPFDLGFRGTLIYPNYQNVFFTLLFGLLAMCGIKYLGEDAKYTIRHSILYYIGVALLGAETVGLVLNTNIVRSLTMDLAFGGGNFYELVSSKTISRAFVLVYAIGIAAFLIIFAVISAKSDNDKLNQITFTVWPIVGTLALGYLFSTDYNAFGVLTIVIIYLFRKKPMLGMTLAIALLSVMSLSELSAFFVLIFIYNYNGKRGINLKYFFYAFYPAHILIIYIIALLFGYASFAPVIY